jgi:hydrogenase maturation protein HypF
MTKISKIHKPQPKIRRRIVVQGMVQGVGFRPFVYGQALRYELGGFVLNDSAGVTIEVEGEPPCVAAFEQALRQEHPPLARVDSLVAEALPARGETAFLIAHSSSGPARATLIAPDVASCEACLRELRDPADRRFGYPFINCTNCGPRFTITRDLPYDRAQTTMAGFALCAACRAEYEQPLDRRFHAQPNACPACGPTLKFELCSAGLALPGASLPGEPSPIELAAAALARGLILAVKGLGGYHLACDATNESAVARLRGRKRRAAKPFALMLPDLSAVQALCVVGEAEAELLLSRRRPIVLLARRPEAAVATAVAPGQHTLGVMLPYTPLHHLLLEAFAAARGPGHPPALVMTSGNLSDEPIAYHDDDARARLGLIADGMLSHNRPIHLRCDDSLARIVANGPQLLRRSRGYAPEPIRLAFAAPLPILACGGHLKNTFCMLKGSQAFVSQHIGDLENLETLQSFREGCAHFARLFEIAPQAVAYDLHPDYLATKEAMALQLAHRLGVQHHHAHIASVLAEHGLPGPVIGVAADGSGYGLDGAVWGGELLIADLRGFERVAHLEYLPLPGGEQAVRQPWRMAASYLQHTYGPAFLELDIPFVRGLDRARWRTLAQMIARRVNCPPTSSLGRLFDAVAALIGLHGVAQYEGQAAIALEQIAQSDKLCYPFRIAAGMPAHIDLRPLIAAIVEDLQTGVDQARIAGRFHHSVAELLLAACLHTREVSGLQTVALSGGVFQNRLLLELLIGRLAERGFEVYLNRLVPPNDGGLSLGQAAVAAARLSDFRF